MAELTGESQETARTPGAHAKEVPVLPPDREKFQAMLESWIAEVEEKLAKKRRNRANYLRRIDREIGELEQELAELNSMRVKPQPVQPVMAPPPVEQSVIREEPEPEAPQRVIPPMAEPVHSESIVPGMQETPERRSGSRANPLTSWFQSVRDNWQSTNPRGKVL
jgi:hypothetical protein